MSTMQSQIIPSGRARSTQRANAATWIAIGVLALLALFGTNFGVIALVAIVGLGSTLILFDRTLRIEPHAILT